MTPWQDGLTCYRGKRHAHHQTAMISTPSRQQPRSSCLHEPGELVAACNGAEGSTILAGVVASANRR
ncbi:unnamed protein product [Toxocara canis]|uniref:Uncharacterized protein n=1 Tax=Toxocara canis TaxID=6265 RepID=A0A183TX74_TOXCA|nr:unnamed protein product [Toxocara canis]